MSSTTTAKRPEGVTGAHLEYLDDLRESGQTNMFGAASYLDTEFPELADGDDSVRSFRASKKAHAILSYWMSSFGDTNR